MDLDKDQQKQLLTASGQVWEALQSMKRLTRMTGEVFPIQTQNLQAWAGLLFPRKKFEIRINPETKDVAMKFTPVKKKKAPEEKALRIMGDSIQALLGGEWLFRAKEGRKLLFTGVRKNVVKYINGSAGEQPHGPRIGSL